MTTHFLRDDDLTPDAQRAVLELAQQLKSGAVAPRPLEGRAVAVIFDKASTRTRVSFSVGVHELGGYPLVLDSATTQSGRGESVEDTVRVLDRHVAAIVWRTYAQAGLERAAAVSAVPVVNALTDEFHPCQVLADLQTVAEHCGGLAAEGPALAGRSLAYLGDGANNMAHSYLLGGVTAGLDVRIGAPADYAPDPAVVDRAHAIASRTGGSVLVTTDAREAVDGVTAVATDTWVSMGQEQEAGDRESPFVPYRVDEDLMARGNDAVFLHCLPVYRGLEATAEVVDGDRSVIWDEAENRRHAQKAVLLHLLGGLT
ncbi:ornithine carbamoyltransferase [Georgenia sp. H159]|uniref:ornithine carbamoyltransferase n=1 Tax=Georgenia sp. H159 TaxID=3076115 RepID=UPI002D77AA38|nr:ornithine carbamoyltransferase [Georgenia sp. H159]